VSKSIITTQKLGLITAMILILCALTPTAQAKRTQPPPLADLYYGEALFYAFQEDYFSSITRLDAELIQHYALDEPDLDSLRAHRSDAEFGVGDLELNYRMHQKAGRAIERVLDAKHIPQIIRNDAAYRLARIYFEKGYYINAAHALNLIGGEVPKAIEEDVIMLRAQVEMTQRNFGGATRLLRRIRASEKLKGYVSYNLGVALIQEGDLKRGAEQLNQVGQLQTDELQLIALRDKANLSLGNRLLEVGQPQEARGYFERVRLDGPFSNKALLWAGWADVASQDFEKALVPWSVLHERDPTDAAVQEALLALPYAYAQLEVFGRAALLYGKAVTEFDKEIDQLDASMRSILDGKLRAALLKDPEERNSTFIQNLRAQADAPETRYMLDLMASHDFQESVKNYRDMEALRLNLSRWLASINAYADLINMRRRYYEPLLPAVERDFKTQDAMMKSVLLRRDEVSRQLTTAQRRRDPQAFASRNEVAVQRHLERIEYQLGRLPQQPGLIQAKARLQRLQGVLNWQLDTDYDRRLAAAYKNLGELDRALKSLQEQHQKVVRFKREAYQSYEGYEIPFQRLRTRLQATRTRIEGVMAQQASYLEKVAVKELDRRRRKLADYRVKARFALAESYDRATKKQAREAEQLLREQQGFQEQGIQEIQDESAPPESGGDDGLPFVPDSSN
jgi:hypothetical protein